MDQEFSGVIQAAPGGLGIAVKGLGCAGVPGLAEVGPLFLRRGGRGGSTSFPPVPLVSVPLVLGLEPHAGDFIVIDPVLHDGLDGCSALVFGWNGGVLSANRALGSCPRVLEGCYQWA